MAKIITIDDIKIHSWTAYIDLDPRRIEVLYSHLSTDDKIVGNKIIATFWETIPEVGSDGYPIPGGADNWYLLPPAYVQSLIDLTIAAKNTLMSTIDE
jgi:hypothetical protein